MNKNGIFQSVNAVNVSETKQQLQLLKDLFEDGRFKAVIDKTFTIENIIEAHRYVDSGRKKGNVILKISKDSEL
nr:zinc-binding dehydrogenase [uncultured Flavobacterium sp.]